MAIGIADYGNGEGYECPYCETDEMREAALVVWPSGWHEVVCEACVEELELEYQ